MKTRNGFVSNSSSTSFVIIATQKIVDKSKKTLSELGKLVIDSETKFEPIVLDGKSYIMAMGVNSSEEFAYSAIENYMEIKGMGEGDESYELSDEAQEQWEKFTDEIEKNGGIFKEEGY